MSDESSEYTERSYHSNEGEESSGGEYGSWGDAASESQTQSEGHSRTGTSRSSQSSYRGSVTSQTPSEYHDGSSYTGDSQSRSESTSFSGSQSRGSYTSRSDAVSRPSSKSGGTQSYDSRSRPSSGRSSGTRSQSSYSTSRPSSERSSRTGSRSSYGTSRPSSERSTRTGSQSSKRRGEDRSYTERSVDSGSASRSERSHSESSSQISRQSNDSGFIGDMATGAYSLRSPRSVTSRSSSRRDDQSSGSREVSSRSNVISGDTSSRSEQLSASFDEQTLSQQSKKSARNGSSPRGSSSFDEETLSRQSNTQRGSFRSATSSSHSQSRSDSRNSRSSPSQRSQDDIDRSTFGSGSYEEHTLTHHTTESKENSFASSQRSTISSQSTIDRQFETGSFPRPMNDALLSDPLPDESDGEVSTFPDVSLTDKSPVSSFEDVSFSTTGTRNTKREESKKGLEDTNVVKEADGLASPVRETSSKGNTNQEKKTIPSPKTTPKTKLKHSKTAPAKEEATREPERIDPFIVEKSKEAASPTQQKEKTTQPVKRLSPRTNPVPPQRSNEPAVKLEAIVETPRCRSLAILGTMSDAGKSIITAGLCRVLANKGVRVAPFKGQNMSNNASPALLPEKHRKRRLYRTFQAAVGGNFPPPMDEQPDTGYGEIGTAQSLQAEACRLVPMAEMNPVLLKSGGQNESGEYLCSVFVLGKQVARETYGELGGRTTDLRAMVLESHEALAEATDCDVILMEGAGSCTELNLIDRDIVNLPLVRALGCPWLLVANIDCGGVFAQIVGTQLCVSKRDWSLCAGIIVNKLRGEPKYFEPGPKMIEDMVGKPVFVVPFLQDLHLPEEDGIGLERRLAWEASGNHHPEEIANEIDKKPIVVVVAYPHTAISDDVCPLEADKRFRVQWRRRHLPRPYPHTTSVILPGSRLTRKDLKWLHDSGWSTFLRKHVAAGGCILGLCGGYQMLGWSVDDPNGVEGLSGTRQGLGLLPIRTKIALPEVKVVAPRLGRLYPKGPTVQGFELHCGQSQIVMNLGDSLDDQIHPLLVFDDGKPEGMCARRVRGTYLHGLLWSPEARVACLVPDKKAFPKLTQVKVEDPLDRLANHLESCGLDFETLRGIISSHRISS